MSTWALRSKFQHPRRYLQLASSVEIIECHLDALGHGLLALANPDTRVVVLLVGLVIAVGVADLSLDVVDL